jgi:hypothetical protein
MSNLKMISNEPALTFTTSSAMYQLKKDVDKRAIRDQLEEKICQAQAAFTMLLCDGGLENFNCMTMEQQSYYLASISAAINESKDLINEL